MQTAVPNVPTLHRLPSTPQTVHCGFFSSRLHPVLDVTAQRREPALRAVDVPLRPHFGVLPAPPLPAP